MPSRWSGVPIVANPARRSSAIAPALETAGAPRPTEEAIAAEVEAARAERRARQADPDPAANDRT